MDEELVHTRYQAMQLQESRNKLAPVWDDEAAREINVRYLNPHADESSLMLTSVTRQVEKLAEVAVSAAAAEEAAILVEALAGEIYELLLNCEQELALSHQFYEHHAQATSVAHALFQEVDDNIRQAESICKGTPKT